jgi:Ca-activated chloride channel family protein
VSAADFFARPGAWPLLLAAPIAWYVFRVLDLGRARRLLRVIGPRTHAIVPDAAGRRRALRRTLLCAGVALAFVAVMGPVWGGDADAAELRGPDVVVCLDVSRSMLARDVAPSRLEAAKRGIRSLAGRARGARLALVAFAGDARLVAPLTADMKSFADLAETADPFVVGRGGSDVGAALDAALDALKDSPPGRGAVLLVTDGEDLGGRGLRAAERCRAREVGVSCVGLGSSLGSKIVVDSPKGETFLSDRAGAAVVSTMDAGGLRRIADATGGAFVDGSNRPDALAEIYEARVVPATRRSAESEERRRRGSRFQAPLFAAFALWIVDLCLGDRRRP